MRPHVETVNVSPLKGIQLGRSHVPTGIFKEPVDGPVTVRVAGVDGDHIGDRWAHGGYEKAVYAYGREDTDWWVEELGEQLGPGAWGENLTTLGIDVSGMRVGSRWRIGDALLVASGPRVPCAKLASRRGEPRFAVRFAAAERPGTYFSVDEEGEIRPGDAIELVEQPPHDVTIRDMSRIYHRDSHEAQRLVDALPDDHLWAQWARDRAAR